MRARAGTGVRKAGVPTVHAVDFGAGGDWLKAVVRLARFHPWESEMRIGSLVLAAIATAGLIGCASTEKTRAQDRFNEALRTGSLKCATQDCQVAVTVTENAATKTCSATVNYPILDFRTGPAGQRKATWTINDGYVFSSEAYKFGIFIKSDPGKQFNNARVEASGKRLVIDFKHNSTGNTYEYALSFQRADGTWCETLDPFMVD
jgi:hypothetical protein